MHTHMHTEVSNTVSCVTLYL